MQFMKKLYHVAGTLNADFVGQITYTVCLDRPYTELDIAFSFDKQHFTAVTPDTRDKIMRICKEKYNLELENEEEADKLILNDAKTEIHTLAMLNDQFIGCIHRQLTKRHMHYSKEETTEGCIPTDTFEGVLEVTILVFNVILDDTHYELTVSGK